MTSSAAVDVTKIATQVLPPAPHPVLIGLKEMVELLPVAQFTVYRWNTYRNGKKQLPDPYLHVSGTSLWTEEQVLEFAARKNLTPNRVVLNRIRRSQPNTRP